MVVIETSHIGQLTNNIAENLKTSTNSPIPTPLKHTGNSLTNSSTIIDISALSLDEGIKSATDDFQRQLITSALENNEGNWSAAARQLKTDRANLNRMAKRLGITIIKTIN